VPAVEPTSGPRPQARGLVLGSTPGSWARPRAQGLVLWPVPSLRPRSGSWPVLGLGAVSKSTACVWELGQGLRPRAGSWAHVWVSDLCFGLWPGSGSLALVSGLSLGLGSRP
jgi:hypothetical protein